MVEYGATLGLDVKSLFSSIPNIELLLPAGLGLVLIAVGYLLKGVWGAVIAFLVGAVLFLYFRGLLIF